MKLEEILPFVRKGHRPTYNSIECLSLHHRLSHMLEDETILSDKWGYLPKYVDWDEAWKALKQGKAIEADYYNLQGSRMERREFRLNNTTHVIEYRQNEHHCWRTYDSSVPLHWLDATNFEILED